MKHKKLALIIVIILLVLLPLANAASYTDTHGYSMGSTLTDALCRGMIFNMTGGNYTLTNVLKNNNATGITRFYVFSGRQFAINGTTACVQPNGLNQSFLLGYGTFTGNNGSLNVPINLQQNQMYTVVADGGNSSVVQAYGSATYPKIGTSGNITWNTSQATNGVDNTLAINIMSLEFTDIVNLEMIINSPSNNTVNYRPTTQNFTFNTTVRNMMGTTNSTHYLFNSSGSLVRQNNGTSQANYTSNFTDLAAGLYYFNATATNSTNTTTSETRIIYFYDIMTGSITAPSNGSSVGQKTYNFTWANATISPTNAPVKILNFSISIYNSDGTTLNRTVANTGNLNLSNVDLYSLLGTGTYWVRVTTFDNQSNSGYSMHKFHLYNPLINYTTPGIEGVYYDFNLTLLISTISASVSSFNATIQYDSTNYTPELTTNSTHLHAVANITLPSVTSTSTKFFYWYFNVNGNNYTTQQYNQSVLDLTPINITGGSCASGLSAAMLFTMQDEETLANINGTIEYNFQFGITNSTYSTIYGTINNSQTFSLCINSTLFPTWTLGTGQIFYSSSGYVDRRYYIFSNTRVTNTTTNITLYNLLSASQTTFDLTVESNSLLQYVGKYTTLVRWYPGINSYNVVDMGSTDNNGRTVIHVVEEDVDYRIGVYETNGSLIYLADPIRLTCLTTPACVYTLTIPDDTMDYISFLNIETSLTYNTTTGIWRLTFNDPSQQTSAMNLTVYKVTGTGQTQICNSQVNAYTGAITCNTSIYTGTLKGVAQRSASPQVPINQLIISTGTAALKTTFILILLFIIAVPIIFVFTMISPILGVIGGVVALIPGWYLGGLAAPVILGFTVLGGIIIHFMRRA